MRKPSAKPRVRKHSPPARVPAQFVTASQALDYLVGPKGPPLHLYGAGHPGATRREMAQRCLIKAHTEERINLLGRKSDMSNLNARSGAFERIPNKYFAHDVILGDSLFTPSRRGGRAAGEFWRDVKMRRQEFEAEFKFSSAEDALIRWWKAKTRYDGKPPTERDASPVCTAAATQTSPKMAVPTTQEVSERLAAKRVGPATRNGAQAERAERSRLEAEPGPEVELDPEVFGRKLQISIAFAFKHETPNAPQANCERGPDKGPSPRLPAHHPPEQDRKDNAGLEGEPQAPEPVHA